MTSTHAYLPLIGRVLIAAIFLMSGLNKIMQPAMTQQYMAAMGMPFTTLMLIGAIAIEMGAGLALLLGYRTRAAAWALFVFMIPTTLIFHTNFGDQNQMIHFMKNLAMIGGLLYVASYGAGAISVDARKETPAPAGVYEGTPAEQRRKTA